MTFRERKCHINYIRKIGSPYTLESYGEILTTIDDKVTALEDDINEQKEILKNIQNGLEMLVDIHKLIK